MLIRIGDEKRESVFLHIDVLKNRIIAQENWIEDTEEVILSVLTKVIQNLPHKVFIYAALLGLVTKDSPEVGRKIIGEVVQRILKESLFEAQDALQVRNFARWLGYLLYLRAVSADAVLQFFSDLVA